MGILNIAPAERAGAHLLIQLYGPPRSGKTYTALRIARGMVGAKGKIGVLDTESGRARLYSDKVPGGFVVGELSPPYTPRRYLEAIEEFLAYGVDMLVVDSFSHCWEGPGGVLEMADQAEENGEGSPEMARAEARLQKAGVVPVVDPPAHDPVLARQAADRRGGG